MAGPPEVDDDSYFARLREAFASAVSGDDMRACRKIVEAVGPNEIVGYGDRTMLMVAAQRGALELCEFLLEAGAQIDAEDEEGRTALFLATGKPEVIRFLLRQGANANIEWHGDDDGGVRTVLDSAARFDNVEACRILLEERPSIDADALRDAMLLAAKNGATGVVSLFLELRPDLAKGHLQKMLEVAAESRSIEMCQHLVANGAVPGNAKALISAAHNGAMSVCRFFVSNGADVNEFNDDGYASLHAAVTSGNFVLVEWLLEQGADVNGSYKDSKWTPICALVQHGYFRQREMARLLVKVGADLSTHPERLIGLTPFQYAVSIGRAELVEFFLSEAGESAFQKARDGRTLIELVSVLTSGGMEVKEILRSASASQAIEAELGEEASASTMPARPSRMPSL